MPSVVIAGAGPAGLATAAELDRAGDLQPLVLEQGDSVGWSWRSRYECLRLNTSRWFSHLRGARYRLRAGVFPARDEVVRYLARYAARRAPRVKLGTRLDRVERHEDRWLLHTSSGEITADQVVIALGYEHTPLIPDWPGRERFRGQLLHAADYRNAGPFRGRDVLVVGPGSSGMEIARDLVDGGARTVCLSVRRPPNMLLRTWLGALFGRVLAPLPARLGDRVTRFVRRRSIGDLSPYGLPEPADGVFSRLQRDRVAPAIVDRSTVRAIKGRRIQIVAATEALDETGAQLADGRRLAVDAVIAATGYHPDLKPLLGHLGVLDHRGRPRATGESPAAPGLRFVGYLPVPAHLGAIAREARRAARAIVRDCARERQRARSA